MSAEDGLPRPPQPAPARRETAIEAAMRRFDGAEDAPAATARGPRSERAPSWLNRPYAGTLVGASLVALIALPLAWTAMDDAPIERGKPAPAENVSDDAASDVARPIPADPAPAMAPAKEMPSRQGQAEPAPDAGTKAERSLDVSEVQLADIAAVAPSAPPPPPPPPAQVLTRRAAPGEAEAVRTENFAAESRAAEPRRRIGAVRSAPAPAAEAADSAAGEIVVTSGRVDNRKASQRGDWNACTVDDPGRDLSACRRQVDPAAKGAQGRAAAHVADGLTRAWGGEEREAIAAFDRAIALTPRSSLAYINRGIAHRRNGDLDRALADLNQAVRYAPDSARAHYQRSLIHRQRGDRRRADADAARAIELDGRYRDLLR